MYGAPAADPRWMDAGAEKEPGGGLYGFPGWHYLITEPPAKYFICPTITKGVVRTRTTSDPKSEKVKLRLNIEMKSHIDNHSREKGISVSEYIRELINQDMINKR